ncbi:MAG: aldolase/citrate lyase family protein [Bacteroidetes bacterium]|nr:aldolase/citrate lyase family protein [Bacteroidota bacterium]
MFELETVVTTGNKGKGIRSDCSVTIELTTDGGIQLQLDSKVKVMYGESISRLVYEIADFFEIRNARIHLEDSGALPFVIAARLEAAIKRLIQTKKEYLTPFLETNKYSTRRDIYRFSRLYLPGNTPPLMINAGLHKPNGIILDLEDAVAPSKKAEARFLVRNALRSLDFYGAERMVRINQIPKGLDDLDYVIPHNVNLILIPKCETVDHINQVNRKIREIQERTGDSTDVWLMPIIESARGIVNCYEIAQAADNIVAMAIGLEDLTADLGNKRTAEGNETFFSRSKVVIACRAAGIQPIDSVFSDVADMEALKQNVLRSKAMGFDGMGCIHPRQIKVIHEGFSPDDQEINKSKKIVKAFYEATAKGLGVVSLGTKMIDPPVVKRAQRTIELAIGMNKLSPNWMEEEENEKI